MRKGLIVLCAVRASGTREAPLGGHASSSPLAGWHVRDLVRLGGIFPRNYISENGRLYSVGVD